MVCISDLQRCEVQVLIIILRDILAIKVVTTGPPKVNMLIVPTNMQQSIEQGIYRDLRRNPLC